MWIRLLDIITIHPVQEYELFHYQGGDIVATLLTLSIVIYMGVQCVIKSIDNPQIVDS